MSRSRKYAIAADRVFDGCTTHNQAAVVIDGPWIEDLAPRSKIATEKVFELPSGAWLAPGFIDIQVNGGGDVLFNDDPTPEVIRRIAAAHRRFGTTSFLPTFITDTPEKMKAAIAAVESVAEQEPSVLGIHLEGPYLSPEKAGVHDATLMRFPTASDVELLVAPRKTVRLVTLAPERVPRGFISCLAKAGILVSLGHSMATYSETCAAMGEGLSGFTHLFNAMRSLESREPGPVAAAIESPEAWFGMIVDGHHVDPAMLRLALRGSGHPILVTDAMPPVGGRKSKFDLYGLEVEVVAGRCLRPDGRLAGAFLDAASAVRNTTNLLHVPLENALRYASTNPAEFLNLGHKLGKIARGYRADLVGFDAETLTVLRTWVAGVDQEVGDQLAAVSPH
jgi:N-acetylglucosamine-6-phosphate deacetylase